MVRKLLITTLAGTLVYFTCGWFIFEFILGDYTNLNTTQLIGFKKNESQSSLTFLIVSCSAYAALLSFILVYLLNTKNIMKAGLIGITIGILVAIMADTYWYATSNFYSNGLVAIFDVLAAGITVGFTAVVIAFTNKKLG